MCAEGGACGNFLISLIRSMWDEEYMKKDFKISSKGSCDYTSWVSPIVGEYAKEVKVDFMSEPESAIGFTVIKNALIKPESTYMKYMSDYQKSFDHISLIHFVEKFHLEEFVKIPNVYVIYVDVQPEDFDLVAHNKVRKRFEEERSEYLDEIKKGYTILLTSYGRRELVPELLALNSLTEISENLLEEMVQCFKTHLGRRFRGPKPKNSSKLLTLQFNDIYNNKELVLDQLSQFVRSTANPTTVEMYEKYLAAQQPILDKIKNA